MLTEVIDRDSIKQNVAVLTVAAKMLGLRVGVKTCTVHVQALYDYMQIPCSRHFGYCDMIAHVIVMLVRARVRVQNGYIRCTLLLSKEWLPRRKDGS